MSEHRKCLDMAKCNDYTFPRENRRTKLIEVVRHDCTGHAMQYLGASGGVP